jgi:hypothetical protein
MDRKETRVTLPQYASFTSAYYALLLKLHSVGSRVLGSRDQTSPGFDECSFELIGEGFTLLNPLDRFPHQQSRNLNLVNAVALTALLLSGEQEITNIAFYNQRASSFADDGRRMIGAHGWRLRTQIWSLVRLLRADPHTRRAMVSVYGPDDISRRSKDVPCVATLQFFIRHGALDLCVQMRSQSAVMVMPYDVFTFTVLQELIAQELHVGVGFYHHYCNNLHYFQREQSFLNTILDDDVPLMTDPPLPFFPPVKEGKYPLKPAIQHARDDFHGFVQHYVARLGGTIPHHIKKTVPALPKSVAWKEGNATTHDRD